MTVPIEHQLREYFADVEIEQGVIDIARMAAPSPSPVEVIIGDAGGIPEPILSMHRPELAPDFDALVSRLQKETDMSFKKSTALLLAAAALVAIVGIFAVMQSGSDDSAPVFTDQDEERLVATGDPLSVALGFVEARDAWDGAAVRALVADDAVIDGFVATADEYLVNDEFERVTGWRFLDPGCAATAGGTPAEVTCTYAMENAWSRALGVGPFPGSSFEFVIEDGLIQEVKHDFDFRLFSPQVWEVFKTWVSNNHPDDVSVMYDFSGADDVPRKTDEAIVLWEKRTNEFISSIADS